MDVHVNGISKETAAPTAVPAPEQSPGYREALEQAMTVVWEERGKHSVLSETFFALTKVWEELFAERCRADAAGKKGGSHV